MSSVALIALLAGCTTEEPRPVVVGDKALTLVYSNNLDGEIEPCG